MKDAMQRRADRQIKIGWLIIGLNAASLAYNVWRGTWFNWSVAGFALMVLVVGACVLRINYKIRETLDEIRRNRAIVHDTLHDVTRRVRNGDQ